jgi:DNA-binding PadR family transcriptional regulator
MVQSALKPPHRWTASQEILIAADDLMAAGAVEFSEWDLTVATWNRDRLRFGLRGYSQNYPDHKRVMMEIMGKKPTNPVLLALMEKLRPNTYRLTARGRAEAARLRDAIEGNKGKPNTGTNELYDEVAKFVFQTAFQKWKEDPDEPRRWQDAAEFLGIKRSTVAESIEKLKAVETILKSAIDWCSKKDVDYLTRGRGDPPIHIKDVWEVMDFLKALKYRFPQNLELGKKLPQKG